MTPLACVIRTANNSSCAASSIPSSALTVASRVRSWVSAGVTIVSIRKVPSGAGAAIGDRAAGLFLLHVGRGEIHVALGIGARVQMLPAAQLVGVGEADFARDPVGLVPAEHVGAHQE